MLSPMGVAGRATVVLACLVLGGCGSPPRAHPPSNDGGANDGGTTDGGTCAPVDFAPTEAVPTIAVLVDGSGSMGTTAGGVTRYQAVEDALVGASGAIPPLQHKAYFGASVFTSSVQTCPQLYTFAPALDASLAISNLLASYSPSGSSPTAPSIAKVLANLASTPPSAGSPPMIVLVTDGLPNDCGSTTGNAGPAITEAGNAYAAGIRLYIVGIASVDTTYLQDMANAGTGVTATQPNATYYTGSDSASLETALATIFGNAICRLKISGGTIDTSQAATGTLTLDGNALAYGTDWSLVDGSTIALLGAACSTFEADASPTVAATFPCSAVKP